MKGDDLIYQKTNYKLLLIELLTTILDQLFILLPIALVY